MEINQNTIRGLQTEFGEAFYLLDGAQQLYSQTL